MLALLLLTEPATHRPLPVPRHLGPLPRLVHGKETSSLPREKACPSQEACEPDLLSSAPPGVACSVILMYTFCTDCWLIAVLYFTWLAFDWNTPKKGNRLLSHLCLPQPSKLALRSCRSSSWLLPLFMEYLLCERPGLGCVWLGVGDLKLPQCVHRAHLS